MCIRDSNNAVPSISSWQRAGDSIFYLETSPGATTASLRVRDAGGRTRTLLDPVSFDQNQSHAAINYFAPSPEGRYVAVGVSLGGSEDATLHIIDTAAAKLLPDAITRTQYAGPSWTPDSKAPYYARLQKLPPGAPPPPSTKTSGPSRTPLAPIPKPTPPSSATMSLRPPTCTAPEAVGPFRESDFSARCLGHAPKSPPCPAP